MNLSKIEARRAAPRALGLVVATIVLLGATAIPALAHASFPSSSAFGFNPNTRGGTGAVGAAPPYLASETPTMYARVPFEQTVPFNGSDDTTVDVKIVVPLGWHDPACGAAMTQINNASTNNTNQPGTAVPNWQCEITEANGRKVIHWHGPQVQTPQTSVDSAQFFAFSVTTPSPLAQTTYNGTNGTEGFITDQAYASGRVVHWIPNAAFTGNPPPGSETIVAGGLARTVAAADMLVYNPLDPARILDTRDGTGLSGPFGPNQTRELVVTGVGGVPADAKVVVLNVTVTGGDHASDLRVWPAGQPMPNVSNLNWVSGQTKPNLVKVRVGTDGKVAIANHEGNVQVIADVEGYYSVVEETPPASVGSATSGFAAPAAATHFTYHGMQPVRILDTRDGTGLSGKFGSGQTRDLVATGVNGVPGDAVAVAVNMTVTNANHASDLRSWPKGQSQPNVSNLNWNAGETVPNLGIIKVGADDSISIRNNEGDVDVIFDVVGYYEEGDHDEAAAGVASLSPQHIMGGLYTGLQPTRILDTRDGTGLNGSFGPGQTRDLTVQGVGGVPAEATEVVINMTVTDADHASDLRVWPAGGAQPNVSNLNWNAGQTVPNLVIAKLGTDGKISIRNNEGHVQVIGDVVGYFMPMPEPAP